MLKNRLCLKIEIKLTVFKKFYNSGEKNIILFCKYPCRVVSVSHLFQIENNEFYSDEMFLTFQ